MLTEAEATKGLLDAMPGVRVDAVVRYDQVWLFRVAGHSSPEEAGHDPFFSVDVETGNLSDFSVMHDGDIVEISRLFAEAERR